MTKVQWDQVGARRYETGLDRGVLFIPNTSGVYNAGFAWNGLTGVTESPDGAESTPQYADNQIYVNLVSLEKFGATVEAFTYPDEFAKCDGTATPSAGVTVGQQPRQVFGLCYRTLVGNDTEGDSLGYKLHMIWGCRATPSEKAYSTVNDSPEAVPFSWDLTTIPVEVTGTNPETGKAFKPTASMTVDSTKVSPTALATLEDFLYGTVGTDPSLPLPTAVIAIFSGTTTTVTPTVPTFTSGTNTITIPTVTGVVYTINDATVTGSVVITQNTLVKAIPAFGYKFPAVVDNDWLYTFV